MTEQERSAGDARHQGFLYSLKSGLASMSSALHTRLELLPAR